MNRTARVITSLPIRAAAPVFALPAVLFIAAACGTSSSDFPTATPTPRPVATVTLGEPATLAPDEMVTLSGQGVSIAFQRVADDSRCPTGVQCVTAGAATVVMSVILDGEPGARLELRVPPGAGVSQVVGDFTVTVDALEPDPPPKKGPRDGDYRLTVSVTRS